MGGGSGVVRACVLDSSEPRSGVEMGWTVAGGRSFARETLGTRLGEVWGFPQW